MTLDEDPYAEPEWLRIARREEAEDRANHRAELAIRDLCESPEAVEAYWAGVMRQMPWHVKHTHYAGGPG
jgi:hypothetical protein